MNERERLESFGVQPKKRWGQNFLVDPRIPELIVERAGWDDEDPVFEIGPGGGALTHALLATGRPVRALEKDRDLVEVLRSRFSSEIDQGRFAVEEGDALEAEWTSSGPAESAALASVRESGRRPWIAGNLPYTITTPLLLKALSLRDHFAGAVLMVQREYGERLLAKVGTKSYSSITVWTRAQATVRSVLKVGRSSFWPRPGVESIVVEVALPETPPFGEDLPTLEVVLRAAFSQRRKTLRNTLASGLSLARDESENILESAEVDPGRRAETLDLPEFERLVAAFQEFRQRGSR